MKEEPDGHLWQLCKDPLERYPSLPQLQQVLLRQGVIRYRTIDDNRQDCLRQHPIETM